MKYSADIRIMGVRARREKYILNELLQLKRDESIVFYDDREPEEKKYKYGEAIYSFINILASDHKKHTHLVICQDDIDICNDFENIVNSAINIFPDAVWSFHHPFTRFNNVKNTNTPYVLLSGYYPLGVCVCMPVAIIDDLINHYKNATPNCIHDDCLLGHYCRLNNIRVMSTIPSLVNHLGALESTMRHKGEKNMTMTWIGKDVNGFNWNSSEYNVLTGYQQWLCSFHHPICKKINSIAKKRDKEGMINEY